MTCGTKITENSILLYQKPVHRYFDFSDPLLKTKPLKTWFSKQNNSMKKNYKKAYEIMKIEKINFKCFLVISHEPVELQRRALPFRKN